MELYDEKVEQRKSKEPIIIGICIVLLLIMTVLVICGIIYLKNSITTININEQKNTEIEELLYIESTENGVELYLPILKMSKHLGYEGFTGDYQDKSEDKSKCHVISKDETAMFTQDSDMLVKVTEKKEKEYIKLDKPVFEKDGELYTTIDGIQKAFNILFSSDENFKNIDIYTMDYLVEYYGGTKWKLQEYSTEFSDKKAIFQNMIILKENGQYGVIDIATGKYILENKYDAISYLPTTTDFLVKSNGKYGIMSKEASIKIQTVYDEIRTMDNKNGLYLVKYNNAYGVVNINGEVIIQPEYSQIGFNVDKYVQNGVENQYVLLDEIIPIKNDENLWALYNIKGEKVTDFKYTGIGCQNTPVTNSYPALVIPSYKIIVVQKDKLYNLVDTNGEELISGYILGSVYFKSNTETGENQFFMTSNNNQKVLKIE